MAGKYIKYAFRRTTSGESRRWSSSSLVAIAKGLWLQIAVGQLAASVSASAQQGWLNLRFHYQQHIGTCLAKSPLFSLDCHSEPPTLATAKDWTWYSTSVTSQPSGDQVPPTHVPSTHDPNRGYLLLFSPTMAISGPKR